MATVPQLLGWDHARVNARTAELLVKDLLGAAIRGGDEIRRALERHLQKLDLAEVALERARSLVHGLGHDIEESGTEHGG